MGRQLNTAGDVLRWTVKVFGALLDQVDVGTECVPVAARLLDAAQTLCHWTLVGSTTSRKDTHNFDLVTEEHLSNVNLVTRTGDDGFWGLLNVLFRIPGTPCLFGVSKQDVANAGVAVGTGEGERFG